MISCLFTTKFNLKIIPKKRISVYCSGNYKYCPKISVCCGNHRFKFSSLQITCAAGHHGHHAPKAAGRDLRLAAGFVCVMKMMVMKGILVPLKLRQRRTARRPSCVTNNPVQVQTLLQRAFTGGTHPFCPLLLSRDAHINVYHDKQSIPKPEAPQNPTCHIFKS